MQHSIRYSIRYMMTTPDVSQQNNSATDLDSNNIDKNEIVTQSVSKGEF